MKAFRWFLIAIPFVLVACNEMAADPENIGKPIVTGALDYGNGVYYFPYLEAKFGNALSQFIVQHKELELLTMTGDGNGSYGRDQGYFVVFRTLRR